MLILFNALGHGKIPRLRQEVLESRSLSRQRAPYVVTLAVWLHAPVKAK